MCDCLNSNSDTGSAPRGPACAADSVLPPPSQPCGKLRRQWGLSGTPLSWSLRTNGSLALEEPWTEAEVPAFPSFPTADNVSLLYFSQDLYLSYPSHCWDKIPHIQELKDERFVSHSLSVFQSMVSWL